MRPHVVVGQFLVADLGPEHVERPLHGVRLGQHLLQQLPIDLLGQIAAVEDVNFALEKPFGVRRPSLIKCLRILDGLQLGESLGVGQGQIDLLLSLLFLLKIIFLAADVGGPERLGGLDLQRPHGGLVVFDELFGPGIIFIGRRLGGDENARDQQQRGGRSGQLCERHWNSPVLVTRTSSSADHTTGEATCRQGRHKIAWDRQRFLMPSFGADVSCTLGCLLCHLARRAFIG